MLDLELSSTGCTFSDLFAQNALHIKWFSFEHTIVSDNFCHNCITPIAKIKFSVLLLEFFFFYQLCLRLETVLGPVTLLFERLSSST